MDDKPTINPIMTDQPEDQEELLARRRAVRKEADQDLALRGAAMVGTLGGTVAPAAGALIGRGGALGIEETQAEDAEVAPSDAVDSGAMPPSPDADRSA